MEDPWRWRQKAVKKIRFGNEASRITITESRNYTADAGKKRKDGNRPLKTIRQQWGLNMFRKTHVSSGAAVELALCPGVYLALTPPFWCLEIPDQGSTKQENCQIF